MRPLRPPGPRQSSRYPLRQAPPGPGREVRHHHAQLRQPAAPSLRFAGRNEVDPATQAAWSPASPEFVKRGGDRKSEGIKVSNTYFYRKSSPKERNSKPGTLRRLARSHPDLLARVESGELSAHAAAVQAGIRKPMRSIPVDTPEAAIRALLRVFTVTDLAQALGKAAEVSPPS